MPEAYAIQSYMIPFMPTRFVLIFITIDSLLNLDYQDKTDDVSVGIRSTALLFGERSRAVLVWLSSGFLSLVSFAGMLNEQGAVFYAGVGFAGIQLIRVLRQTTFNSRSSCWKGFTRCGWAGFWIWFGAFGDYILLWNSQ
jgi:4-hydroxybenzoate polyprenyltransferase